MRCSPSSRLTLKVLPSGPVGGGGGSPADARASRSASCSLGLKLVRMYGLTVLPSLPELLPRIGGILEVFPGDLDGLLVVVLVRQDAELETADALDQVLDALDLLAGQGAFLLGGPVVADKLVDVAGGDLRVDLVDALGQ